MVKVVVLNLHRNKVNKVKIELLSTKLSTKVIL
jgi:hypothetical protein